ncbi:hypothetical protein GCM10011611_26370 [Aliidongia dinghuensis]|uniref:Uncharacterized protein n=1 Tax=Aliidongia dinghuensis TaxID=1867774 RepID=A0A8J2YU80_9PROT|nr:hypothetical protein [Aliidongia dinghuensis]GGF19198.1 hypothetical protein GCM10011611_26370 [Aliidongia dinghuensis]
MAGDIWEMAVEEYLTMDRGLFLNPQYVIGTPGEWEASADFLALAFPERIAWMVEVTKAPRPALYSKIKGFESDYAPRIREGLARHKVVPAGGAPADWRIGLWIFAPKTALTNIKEQMEKAAVQLHDVTALDDTLASDAWGKRFR